jgi:hypothetical protein
MGISTGIRAAIMAKEIPLSKGMVALVDDDDYERVSQFNWYCNGVGYAYRTAGPRKNRKGIYLHRFIMGEPNGIIDHINHDKLDCRKANLRVTDKSGNGHNRVRRPLGIYWDKRKKLWMARIKVRGIVYELGRFEDRDAALRARRSGEARFNLYSARTCDSR